MDLIRMFEYHMYIFAIVLSWYFPNDGREDRQANKTASTRSYPRHNWTFSSSDVQWSFDSNAIGRRSECSLHCPIVCRCVCLIGAREDRVCANNLNDIVYVAALPCSKVSKNWRVYKVTRYLLLCFLVGNYY